MAADCGLELKAHNVAYISLWPGAVKTELIQQNTAAPKKPASTETLNFGGNAHLLNAFANGESTEFSGKCVVALSTGLFLFVQSSFCPCPRITNIMEIKLTNSF
jgi:dehydrogenase/reductase SDR family member 1